MDLEFLIGLGVDAEAGNAIMAQFEKELSEMNARRISDKYSLCVNYALLYAGAVNVKAAAAVLEHEFTGEDFDTEPEGLKEAIDKLCEDAPYLFREKETKKKEDIYTFVGITPAAAVDTDTDAGELSYSEYMRLYRN